MGHKHKGAAFALLAGLLILGGLLIIGCESAPNGGNGNDAEYSLFVVLERNLETNQDIIYLKFRRDGQGIPGAVVVVDGDTLTTLPASGQGNKTYPGGRWLEGELIQIAAIDTSHAFQYRDSISLPTSFLITDVIPPNRLWQGGNVTLAWTGSLNASDYAISVKPRTIGSSARGLGAYDEDADPLSETFAGGDVFTTSLGVVVADVYDMQVIAYSQNFVIRPNTPYKVPPVEDVRVPIGRTNIDGAIAALVVCEKDTILVPQTQ